MRADTAAVVGTGYVGTASAIALAELGWRVVGFDRDASRIAQLRAGIPPYTEAGLESPLRRHLESGKLKFVSTLSEALNETRVLLVAVNTPANPDGSADLSALEAFARSLLDVSAHGFTVVLRSTVPPGTSDRLAETLRGNCDVVYAPEFLREGTALTDFMHPDRTVIGATSRTAGLNYFRLVQSLEAPTLFTTRRNAELIKACSNAFLALKVSFANEVANLCDALGADVDDVLRGVSYDRRIGRSYLVPGIGFGGPCLEKDTQSLESVARSCGCSAELLGAALRVNWAQPMRIVETLERELGNLSGAHIGVWGLTFKAGTNDVRHSLAPRILTELRNRGAIIVAYDPALRDLPFGCPALLVDSALDAAHGDALLILTEWPEFREIDPGLLATRLRQKLVVDGRNVLDPQTVAAAGLRYRGVGRSAEPHAPKASPGERNLSVLREETFEPSHREVVATS